MSKKKFKRHLIETMGRQSADGEYYFPTRSFCGIASDETSEAFFEAPGTWATLREDTTCKRCLRAHKKASLDRVKHIISGTLMGIKEINNATLVPATESPKSFELIMGHLRINLYPTEESVANEVNKAVEHLIRGYNILYYLGADVSLDSTFTELLLKAFGVASN